MFFQCMGGGRADQIREPERDKKLNLLDGEREPLPQESGLVHLSGKLHDLGRRGFNPRHRGAPHRRRAGAYASRSSLLLDTGFLTR